MTTKRYAAILFAVMVPFVISYTQAATGNLSPSVIDLPDPLPPQPPPGPTLLTPANNQPIPNPVAQEIVVFVVEPSTYEHDNVQVVPLNQDLLQGFALFRSLHIVTYNPVNPAKQIRVHRLATIQRFPDPLKRPKNESILRPPGQPDITIWQTRDGKRITSRLLQLVKSNQLSIIDPSMVTTVMLTEAVQYAHFRRVPNRYNPAEANTGGVPSDIHTFQPNDMQTCCH